MIHISKTYIPYHMHTDYSLRDSCTKAQEYVDLAVENGIKALSFSEHGKISNWTEKWSACKKAGIKYIHSVEIYLTETLSENIRDNYHTVLMAKNIEGLRELNRLVTLSFNKDHFFYKNRLSFEEFTGISDNIITTSACIGSPLNKIEEDNPMFERLIQRYDFLEIQHHNVDKQKEFNEKLYRLSLKYKKPLIAGTDTHSSNSYKAECRKILLMSDKKLYEDEDSFDLTFKTYDELVRAYEEQDSLPREVWLQAIESTNLLFDMTEEIELDTSIKYPILYGTREEDSRRFLERTYKMFEEKLVSGVIPHEQETAFRSAIEEEARVFKKLNMEGFMLSMSELVSWCREKQIPLSPARGSVGGSRIAYVTDITDLNPETWHTVFSRFCNEDREEIGDIDIDMDEADRPAIFEHIVSRFGTDKTARVASFGTFQSKAAIDAIGRYLAYKWKEEHPNRDDDNPWALNRVEKIKKEFSPIEESCKKNEEKIEDSPEFEAWCKKYSELSYYLKGLTNIRVSQSVHPAGMVISPISLDDNFGTFNKDGDICLMLDMDNVHDFTGLAKYDFLILKTIKVLRTVCEYIGKPMPKSHEIDWNDQEVWNSMITDATGLFQMEGRFAYDGLKKFKPKSIFELSLVTACLRPTGASYRDELLARKPRKNVNELIDNLLKDNLGYLVYQEDTIKFLQDICGLSGSEADNIRRAIGRKQKDRLEKAMPKILEGYCAKSSLPHNDAEEEAKDFLQVIEDSANYQFGYNHSIAYSMITFLCAYYRHYYTIEFITAFLNNATNDDDIKHGSEYARKLGFSITLPRWGISKGDYFYNNHTRTIAQGLSAVKYLGKKVAGELYEISQSKTYTYFMDILLDLEKNKVCDTRQLHTLIKLDYFVEYGNQRELLRIADTFNNLFKKGQAIQINKARADDSVLREVFENYATCTNKNGKTATTYKIPVENMVAILRRTEEIIKGLGLEDLDDINKILNFKECMGYIGYSSYKEKDRRKLYITELYPLNRKSDGKHFGYSVITKSIGSGVEGRFTVYNRVFNKNPIKVGDIIWIEDYTKDNQYYTMQSYRKLFSIQGGMS